MQETLSLYTVAGEVGVSANYFSAVFSQEMEVTFIEYVTQKRMEKAKKLLRQTEKPSRDIAVEVGYKDPHYFSFVFKKTQGCTPREYRTRGNLRELPGNVGRGDLQEQPQAIPHAGSPQAPQCIKTRAPRRSPG